MKATLLSGRKFLHLTMTLWQLKIMWPNSDQTHQIIDHINYRNHFVHDHCIVDGYCGKFNIFYQISIKSLKKQHCRISKCNCLWNVTLFIKQQAVTFSSVQPDLCHHMVASLGHNLLNLPWDKGNQMRIISYFEVSFDKTKNDCLFQVPLG